MLSPIFAILWVFASFLLIIPFFLLLSSNNFSSFSKKTVAICFIDFMLLAPGSSKHDVLLYSTFLGGACVAYLLLFSIKSYLYTRFKQKLEQNALKKGNTVEQVESNFLKKSLKIVLSIFFLVSILNLLLSYFFNK
jgi:hypothetical protein